MPHFNNHIICQIREILLETPSQENFLRLFHLFDDVEENEATERMIHYIKQHIKSWNRDYCSIHPDLFCEEKPHVGWKLLKKAVFSNELGTQSTALGFSFLEEVEELVLGEASKDIFTFVPMFTKLEAIHFSFCNSVMWNSLKQCSQLKTIQGNLEELRVESFPSSLERLWLTNRKEQEGLTHLFSCPRFRELGVTTHFFQQNHLEISLLRMIETLSLFDFYGNVDVQFLRSFPNQIKELKLFNAFELSRLNGLEHLTSLEKIVISGSNLSDLSALNSLSHLKELQLVQSCKAPNPRDLRNLSSLERLHIDCDTGFKNRGKRATIHCKNREEVIRWVG